MELEEFSKANQSAQARIIATSTMLIKVPICAATSAATAAAPIPPVAAINAETLIPNPIAARASSLTDHIQFWLSRVSRWFPAGKTVNGPRLHAVSPSEPFI